MNVGQDSLPDARFNGGQDRIYDHTTEPVWMG